MDCPRCAQTQRSCDKHFRDALVFFYGERDKHDDDLSHRRGREGKETPVGEFKVTKKIVDPPWHVPKSIRLENPELPAVVPPGPENPRGTHALRLSIPSVLIHGTDKPWTRGRRQTHDARLYPEDMIKFFDMVRKGEKVTIVRQPIKVGVLQNRVFMEVHNDENSLNLLEAVNALGNKKLLDRVDGKKMLRPTREKSGIPVDITKNQTLTRDELDKVKLFPPDWKNEITK